MKKIFPFPLLVLLLVLIPSVSLFAHQPTRIQLTPGEQAFLQEHPTITLGIGKSFEPLIVVKEDGSVSGYTADILDMINKHTGANFIQVYGNWAGMVDKAKAREIDGLSLSLGPVDNK